QRGIVGLGEALGLALTTVIRADAVDQPGITSRLVRPGADQSGHRHPTRARGAHRHDRGMTAPAPRFAFRRPQALTGFVFEAQPRPRSAANLLSRATARPS